MSVRFPAALLAAGLFVLPACQRDLNLPTQPQFASLAGALDTGGKVPAVDNEVRLINLGNGFRADQRTDADGGFAFGGLPPGAYLVQADVPGFAPLREGPFAVSAGAAVDLGAFTLTWLGATQSEGTLSGLVTVSGLRGGGPDGGATPADGGLDRPSDAQGATVAYLLRRSSGEPVKVAEATVDAFGRFSARVPPGSYDLVATHPWYISSKAENVTLAEAQVRELAEPIVLQVNPAEVSGTVVVEVENSATGATQRPAQGVLVFADTGLSIATDVDGRFVLGGLPAGTRTLTFVYRNFHDEQGPRAVTLAPASQADLGTIKLLIDRGDLEGRVRMGDGSQLDNVSVLIAGAADGGVGAYVTQAVRSANDPAVGDFKLRAVPVGTYNVVARRTNYVDATSAAIDVKLAEVARVAGELRLQRLQGDFQVDDGDPLNTPGFTRSRDVTLVLSNVMNAAEFRVVEGSSQALATASWQPYAAARIPFTLSSGDGEKTLSLQLKNTSGNEGAPLSAGIVLDTTPPSSLSLELASGAAFTRLNATLPVTLDAVDQGGVAWVRLAAVEADGGVTLLGGGVGLLAGRVEPFVRDTSFARPTQADGVQGVVAQFIDNAGNPSALVQDQVVVDTVPPTGTLRIARGARATLEGYTNSLLVTLEESWASEPNGGFVQLRLANDALGLATAAAQNASARASWFLDAQGEGKKFVHYVFIDAAGNLGTPDSEEITYDATSPLVSATLLSPTLTSTRDITIGLATVETSAFAPDAGLAVSESALFSNAQVQGYPASNQVTYPLAAGDGARTVYVRVKDAAGNEGNASVSVELDTSAPTGLGIGLVGTLADGTPSSTLTASATVTVNLTQSGATLLLLGDGALTSCPPVGSAWRTISGTSIANHPLPGAGATRTVTACFADGAGNVAGPVSASIALDTAAPAGCQLAMTGLRTDGVNSGTARTALRSVPFTLTNCDDVPLEIALTEQTTVSCAASAVGLTWAPYSAAANQLTLSSVDGAKTVRGCVRDAARNTAAFTAGAITLDTTPPTNAQLSLNGGAASVNAASLDGGVAVVSVAGSAVGAAEWAIAEEGTTPSTWLNLATTNPVSLALSAGDGVKTVRALFRDDLRNTIAVAVGDTIEVDTGVPTLTSFTLSGTLADGTPSTSLTASAEVTANLGQTGATTVYLSQVPLTTCPATGHVPLSGSTAPLTLAAQGARTVYACVGDAANNLSAVRQATITWDATGPSGCALVLTGLRADDAQPTSGAGAGRSGRRDVRFSLTNCVEEPAQIVLTESTVSCAANNGLVWSLYDSAQVNAFTVSAADGTKTVRACVRDAARNTQSVVAATIVLDTTAPTGTSVLLDNGAAYVNEAQKAARGNVNLARARGAAVGATEWQLTDGTSTRAWAALGATPVDFTFTTGDGVKLIRASFRDEVGNVTATEATDSIEFDTTAPTLTGLLLTGSLRDGTASTASTSTLVVNATLTHGGGTRVAFGAGATLDCSTATYGPLTGTTVATTLSGAAGTLTASACVTDEAGNPSQAVADSIVYDPTAPSSCTLVLSGRTASGGATALDKTALRDVPFTFSGCSEAPADVYLTEAATLDCNANLDWKPVLGGDLFTLSAVDGAKTVRGCVRDATRNAGALVADSLVLDTTAPTGVSVQLKGGAAYFNQADFLANTPDSNAMAVTGTASGALEWALAETVTPSSWVSFSSPATTTFAFSAGDGTKTIRALFRDDVGNVTVAEATDTIEVDTVGPTLTGFLLTGTLADGQESTVTSATASVTATLTATGATRVYFGDSALSACPASGYGDLSGTTATTTLPAGGATRTVKACVADLAGNTAGPLADDIGFDSAAPQGCQLVLTGRNTDGTSTSGATAEVTALRDVGVALTSCNEAVTEIYLTESTSVTCSAVNSYPWQALTAATQFTLSSVDLLKTVRGCVRDAANNTLAFTADTITLDTTAPTGATVLIKGGAAYFNQADAQANTPVSNAMSVTGSAAGATQWAVAESASPSNWTAVGTPVTVTFSSGEGLRTAYALFRDAVGNVTPVGATDTIIVDRTPPSLTGIGLTGTLADGTPSETFTVSPAVQLALAHSDGTGLSVSDGVITSCPSASYASFSGTSASITLPGTGSARTLSACISDVAGNLAGPLTDSITFDNAPPSGCALTLVGRRAAGVTPSGATADKTAQSLVGVSLGGGCTGATEVYLVEASSVGCAATASFSWQTFTSGATNFALTGGDASKQVVGCVRDAARNVATASLSDTITLDTTPPTATSIVLHGGLAYFNRAAWLANTPDSNTMSLLGTATGAAEWAYAENATPTAWVAFASPATVQFPMSAGDGPKAVRALFRDDLYNTSTLEVSDSIEVDTLAPTLTSISVTGTLADGTASTTLTTSSSVSVSFAQSGGTLVAVGDEGFSCPTAAASFSAFNGTNTTATLTSASTPRTVKACVADAAGNTSAVQTTSITFDATAPTSCQLTLVGKRTDGTSTSGGTAEKTAQTTVTATLGGCSEAPTDIYLVETTGAVTCPAPGSAVWQSLSGGSTFPFTVSPGDVTKTVKACVRDAARNVSASSLSDTITLDTTPPSDYAVSLHGAKAYFNLADFLANTPDSNAMTVTGTATGAVEWAFAENTVPAGGWASFSGPSASTTSAFSSGDGTKRVFAVFRDDVGNATSTAATDTVEVDTSPPTLTALTLEGTLGNGLSSETITATTTVTAKLRQAGATKFNFGGSAFACPAAGPWTSMSGDPTITLPGSGTPRTVSLCVADAADNPSVIVTDDIQYDGLTALGCALVLTGRRADGVDTSGATSDLTALPSVKIGLAGCSESGLQVALTESSTVSCTSSSPLTWVDLSAGFTLKTGDGLKTVYGCVRDAAWNIGSLTNDSITLDTTPPANPSVTLDDSNGYSAELTRTASGTAEDATEWAAFALSGTPAAPNQQAWSGAQWDSFPASPSTRSVTFPVGDGVKTLFVKFRDAVGNESDIVTDRVTVDTTPPTAPVLLTVDPQNRGARLFWDQSSDVGGVQRYELLSAGSGTPSIVRSSVAGTATDGYVLGLENRVDQVFAVRAVDFAGNVSPLSGLRSTSIGWDRTTVNPGSVYPIRPLDIAARGKDVYVTYMETDTNWTGTGGTLWVAVSRDRGVNWAFMQLDANFGGGRSQAPIAFTEDAVWIASVANPGFESDLMAGQVALWRSIDRGQTWTNMSDAALALSGNYGKVDGLGLMTSGKSVRLRYMLASASGIEQINTVSHGGGTSKAVLVPGYDVSTVFGSAPYQATGRLRACSGNFSSLTMWRDRNTASRSLLALRALTHYYLPDNTFDSSTGEGAVEAVTTGFGAGEEVGNYDLACTSLPETMQAYVVYDRAPASGWVVGSNGTILQYDDAAWVAAPSPTTRTINSVQDVWAVGAGYLANGTNYTLILRWNGLSWEELKVTAANGNSLFDSWTIDSSNAYAVGGGGSIVRWDGSGWAAQTSGTTATLYGVWAASSSTLFAVGSAGTIMRTTNGTTWSSMTSGTTATLRAVWGTSPTNVFAVGDGGLVLRWNGANWQAMTSNTTAALYSVWGTSSTNVWAVGASGTIIRFDGSTWSTVASGTTAALYEVSGSSSADIWAVGISGTALRYNGTSWVSQPTETTQSLNSVWWGGTASGSANALYLRRKLGSMQAFTNPRQVPLASDADRTFEPQVWAGGRNVYVLYRSTADRLLLGESVDEGNFFANWTTVESGGGKGFYAVLSGDNSSDVALAYTDINASTFTVMVPALPAVPLTASAGIGTATVAWTSVAGVDRYQLESDPDGASPWSNIDFTSLTQATVPAPPWTNLASSLQVRAVDAQSQPGNTGELWQMRPLTDKQLTTTTSTIVTPSSTGGIVAYDDKVLVWPPRGAVSTASEFLLFRSTNSGDTWTSFTPAGMSTVGTGGKRAMAGFGGRAALFFEDSANVGQLRVLSFPDYVTAPTLSTLQSGIGINFIAAKTSTDNTGLVVAYADVATNTIRVATANGSMVFSLRTSISTTAGNTIGALEVAKVDFSQQRIVIAWREYTTGDPRDDLIRMVESTDNGVTWGAPVTALTGNSSSTSSGGNFTIGNTLLSGASNGAYSVLARATEANDFLNYSSSLYLTVTGTDHPTSAVATNFINFELDSESVDSRSIDAFANSDGHYVVYRAENIYGTAAKLRLAYCFSDCHLFSSWDRSLLKVWASYVRDQGRFVGMTVAQTSSSAYDPALYVLYQEVAGTTRYLKVLTRGVHRRTR